MLRFLALALPLDLLTLAISHFGVEALGLPVPELPGVLLVGLWLLEAIGLVALFLLVRGHGLGRWLAGVASAWIAWVFRGPVLLLSAGGLGRAAGGTSLALAWLLSYTVCGLLEAGVSRPGPEGAEAS